MIIRSVFQHMTLFYFLQFFKTTDMKNLFLLMGITVVLIAMTTSSYAQAKPKCIVLNMDAQGIDMDAKQMGNLLRLELDKLGKYEVVDRYDVAYLIEKNDLKIDNCFGKICLLEVGNKLKVDYILTGSTERFGETIIMTTRLINVNQGIIERTQVMEYKALTNEIQTMVNINLSKMFGIEIDKNLEVFLTKKDSYESAINNPDVDRLNLSGPRMGLTLLTGEAGRIMQAPKDEGGFDNFPFMTAFGYQYEVQYLNEGNFQALFEFIPLVSGLDQGLFIPSLTVLHGVRNNRNGFEFAFGPTISGAKVARGYYDADNNWILRNDWYTIYPDTDPPVEELRMDSRGRDYTIRPGFVFAAGMTLKSGKLNMPINAFVIPSKGGTRVGVSMGFNAKK